MTAEVRVWEGRKVGNASQLLIRWVKCFGWKVSLEGVCRDCECHY